MHSGHDLVKRQEDSSCLQAKERPQETKPADTLALDFQNSEKIDFCCLSHLVYGIFFFFLWYFVMAA